jgi:phospholipase A-2-activating protein
MACSYLDFQTTSSLAVYPEESAALTEIFADLEDLTATPPRRSTSSLNESHIDSVISILERWPTAQRFPVIDLGRLILAFCGPTFSTPRLREKFVEALFKASEWNTPWSSPIPKTRETNTLLLFRSLANVFGEKVDLPSSWVIKVSMHA